MKKKDKIKVGISVGDLNGIGIEVILKSFEDARMLDFCTPVIFGSSKAISYHKKAMKIGTQIHGIDDLSKMVSNKLNLYNVWKEMVDLDLGTPTEVSGNYAFKSLEASVKALKEGAVDCLLTAPIDKNNIQGEGFNFSGHTEYLESQLEGESLMILMTDQLRVGLITGHIPIEKVAESISAELIDKKVRILYESLKKDFGITKPRIAVLGLDPHCGDKGVIGTKDEEVVQPCIEGLQKEGKLVYGPFAADSFFGQQTYKKYDAVLAMYHDQGLTPFKTLSFGHGVNFTAGLSHVRTSPDHGTAFEIAGKGQARYQSFKEALFSGIELVKRREDNLALLENQLERRPEKKFRHS